MQLGLQIRDALLGRSVSSGLCLHHVRARRFDRIGLNQRLHPNVRQCFSIMADLICWDIKPCLQCHGDHACAGEISIACTTSAGSALMSMALANACTHMSILRSSTEQLQVYYTHTILHLTNDLSLCPCLAKTGGEDHLQCGLNCGFAHAGISRYLWCTCTNAAIVDHAVICA